MKQLYDEIGIGYRALRSPEPIIAEAVLRALGDSPTVVNVGAGAGSYEPLGRCVVAVEPSLAMIAQRGPACAPAIRAKAEALPFGGAAFSAAMAILTVHHWRDREAGLKEMMRVASDRVVIVTFDPEVTAGFWLVKDYLPEVAELDYRSLPSLRELFQVLGDVEIRKIAIPAHCRDGFLGAYWQRPHAYLDANIRKAISVFFKLRHLEEGLRRLRDELESGLWLEKYGKLMDTHELDVGYRLITARRSP